MNGMRKVTLVLVVTVVFGFLVAAGIDTVRAQSAAELIALADQIRNENPGIGFEISTEKGEYSVGEKVVFEFKADRDCYLSIIDIGTSGKTIILFPNKWQTENKIEKDKVYLIPPEAGPVSYKVTGPTGTEKIKVIASLEPVMANVASLQEELRTPVGQADGPGVAFLSMKNPQRVLKDLAVEVSKIDPSKWATSELTFVVKESAGVPSSQPPTIQEQQKGNR